MTNLVKPLFTPKRQSDDYEAKCEELAQAHKINEALLATNRALELDAKRYRYALEQLARLGNGELYGNSTGNQIALAAIRGEQA